MGRLDKDTEGLLLLTDDGPLGHDLLSPRKHVDKVYYARVDGQIDEEDVQALSEGMTLGDGLVCLPANLEPLGNGSECLVTLRRGNITRSNGCWLPGASRYSISNGCLWDR